MKTFTLTLSLLAVLLIAAGNSVLADEDVRTVSVELQDASVAQGIKAVAEAAGINVIVSPEAAKRRVTLSLHDVPWKAALDALATSAGLKLWVERHGVYRVAVDNGTYKPPSRGEPFVKWSTLAARQKLEGQLAQTQAKIKALEAELARAHRTRVDAESAAVKLKAEGVQLDKTTGRVTDAQGRLMPGALVAPNGARVVHLYDVRDVDLKKGGVTTIIERLRKEGAQIDLKNDKHLIIVNGSNNAQMRMRVALTNARKKQGKDVEFVTGRLTTTSQAKRLIVSGKDGEAWYVTDISEKEGALKDRAGQLDEAARLLDEAGAKDEAARVREQARKTRDALVAALERRRADMLRSAAVRAQAGGADLASGIEALRDDVAKLRDEVQVLTKLVHELLEQRRR